MTEENKAKEAAVTTEPEATEPEATEPEATEPEATEPEATEPEATEPEATPEPTELEATQEAAAPDEPEAATSEETDPEAASEEGGATETEEAPEATETATKEDEPKGETEAELEVVAAEYAAKQKPELDDEVRQALAQRAERKSHTPAFRRQEWFRYKKLGGKNAPWRRPRGIHSKMRRHFKYRPNVVSIGYGGPAAARGLHPSGFEEVLVYRPEDLDDIDPKKQAARVGGTVGGRKAEAIEKKADDMGIRILNRRGS